MNKVADKMKNCIGIINLDENENRMGELVDNSCLAAIPIAARYRIIDFVLSNMTNSGINHIGIFSKIKCGPLIGHLANGMPWGLNSRKNQLKVFNFRNDEPVYEDINNFAENMRFLTHSKKEYVLLSPSYMLCNIDYNEAIEYHKSTGKDITIIYKKIDNAHEAFIDCDILNFEGSERIMSVGKNIGRNSRANISMEMYVLKTELFINIVNECICTGKYRKIKDYIHNNLNILNCGGFEFTGYLNCINSIKALYDGNGEFFDRKINEEVFNNERPIYTKMRDETPTYYLPKSNVVNSIIANGCRIEGTVENCIISRSVYIGKNTRIKDCIIMENSNIDDDVVLNNVIADRSSEIRKGESLIGSAMYPLVVKRKKQY
jgi:glucose-1-phosphate adenylyltransferase